VLPTSVWPARQGTQILEKRVERWRFVRGEGEGGQRGGEREREMPEAAKIMGDGRSRRRESLQSFFLYLSVVAVGAAATIDAGPQRSTLWQTASEVTVAGTIS
jgi:hypothetical protein